MMTNCAYGRLVMQSLDNDPGDRMQMPKTGRTDLNRRMVNTPESALLAGSNPQVSRAGSPFTVYF